MVINIKITDKRPSVEGAPVIVCGNSDYTIKFTFDAEWDAYSTKTVRFIWVENGKVRFKDVEMENTTECNVPKLHSTNSVRIGVYAGDLHTTTRAVIPCEWSILCEGGKPATEDYQYYANEAMDAAREAKDAANEAKDAANEAKDAANEAKDAASSAAASANKAGDSADEAAVSAGEADTAAKNALRYYTESKAAASRAEKAAEEAENVVEEKGGALFSNALKGKKSGGIVAMSDISPLKHTLDVRVRSKNLVPFPYKDKSGYSSFGITYTVNEDRSITAVGTATGFSGFVLSEEQVLEGGKSYILSNNLLISYKNENGETKYYQGTASYKPFAWEKGWVLIQIYYQVSPDKTVNDTYYPFIVEATDTPEYTPYIADVSAVKVKKLGKNLINPTDYVASSKATTLKGNVFTTPFTSGTLFFNNMKQNPIKAGTYTVTVTPVDCTMHFSFFCYSTTDSTFTPFISQYKPNVSTPWSFTFTADVDFVLALGGLSAASGGGYGEFNYTVQLAVGATSTDTEYEPYIEPVEYPVNADGTAEGVTSIYPTTTLLTDIAGAVVDVEYNRDINKAFAELYNAIISLGGNV